MRLPYGDYDPHMTRTFRAALLNVLETRDISLRAIADGAGVSYEQLKKLKQAKTLSTNVDDAKKVANFLGVSLDSLLDDPDTPSPLAIVDLYNQLSSEERQFLIKSAKGLVVQAQQADE
jgi:transcriptional regulator with XRE-family HTH domain